MKKYFSFLLSLTMAIFLLVSCAPSVVTVRPSPVVKIRPLAPSPAHIWVNGNYVWRGGHYVFVDGYWAKPHNGRHWIEGYWRPKRGGYVWVPGRWR
jgi:hypothetical protein